MLADSLKVRLTKIFDQNQCDSVIELMIQHFVILFVSFMFS